MSTTPAASPLPAVVLGGGLAGLAAARLLRRHFPRVVVLERDRRPETAEPEDAFASWERRGVPQFRHSRAFLARLRVVLLARLPDVLDRLRAAGVREFGIDEVTPPGVALAPRADDEDVVLLACRRSTFEWALRASVAGRPGIELGEGVMVESLVGEARDGGRPTVTGVRLADGSTIPAAIVVDATGRRSRAPGWLAALGAPAPYERSAETGIFYYTRFYRLRRGRGPRGTTGLVAGDLGWVKLAIFPGDNRTFSITVGAPVDDHALGGRAVAHARHLGADRGRGDARPRHGTAPQPSAALRRSERAPARDRLLRDRRRRLPLEPDLRARRALGLGAGGAARRGARAPPARPGGGGAPPRPPQRGRAAPVLGGRGRRRPARARRAPAVRAHQPARLAGRRRRAGLRLVRRPRHRARDARRPGRVPGAAPRLQHARPARAAAARPGAGAARAARPGPRAARRRAGAPLPARRARRGAGAARSLGGCDALSYIHRRIVCRVHGERAEERAHPAGDAAGDRAARLRRG